MQSVVSNFEETVDDIENCFLADPEKVSSLVGLWIEAEILIEETVDEINRGRLVALKTHCKTTIWQLKMQKEHLEKLHEQDRNRKPARNND